MKEYVEEIADRQKNCKTVPQYSTEDKCIRTKFKKNFIDVWTIVNKKHKVTRYYFDRKHISTDINENVQCDRISKNSFKIDYDKEGYVYVIYKGDSKKDKDWWIRIIYPGAKVKEG